MKRSKTIMWILVMMALIILIFNSLKEDRIIPSSETPVINEFNLKDYSGLWYEVARYPNKFQEGCKCSTAEYNLEDDHIKVLNTCYLEDGTIETIEGKAFLTETPGLLKVQFFPLIKSNYQIIYLDDTFSLVAGDNLFWILSRDPKADTKQIITIMEDKGYDPNKLIWGECYE